LSECAGFDTGKREFLYLILLAQITLGSESFPPFVEHVILENTTASSVVATQVRELTPAFSMCWRAFAAIAAVEKRASPNSGGASARGAAAAEQASETKMPRVASLTAITMARTIMPRPVYFFWTAGRLRLANAVKVNIPMVFFCFM
jgi:hypothetical protein